MKNNLTDKETIKKFMDTIRNDIINNIQEFLESKLIGIDNISDINVELTTRTEYDSPDDSVGNDYDELKIEVKRKNNKWTKFYI